MKNLLHMGYSGDDDLVAQREAISRKRHPHTPDSAYPDADSNQSKIHKHKGHPDKSRHVNESSMSLN